MFFTLFIHSSFPVIKNNLSDLLQENDIFLSFGLSEAAEGRGQNIFDNDGAKYIDCINATAHGEYSDCINGTAHGEYSNCINATAHGEYSDCITDTVMLSRRYL